MKTYKIEIEEILTRVIEVEAENQEQAYDQVYEQYDNEEIVLDASDFNGDTKFYVLDDNNNRVCEL